uniref:Protein kinase domain-containing protein n=1 Tax=Oryzias latipes TaxID=8090 RepID=A0A3P9JVU3_ORYLA
MPQGEEFKFRVMACNAGGCGEPAEVPGTVIVKEMLDSKNLHNKYAIAEELGRGQFGIVHRCVNISSEKTYMAKFVKVRGADQAIIKKEIVFGVLVQCGRSLNSPIGHLKANQLASS